MSPEHDLNLPTATVESASTDASAEIPQGSAGGAMSEPPSGAVSMASASSTGTGAAVARAPEPGSADNGAAEQLADGPAATKWNRPAPVQDGAAGRIHRKFGKRAQRFSLLTPPKQR